MTMIKGNNVENRKALVQAAITILQKDPIKAKNRRNSEIVAWFNRAWMSTIDIEFDLIQFGYKPSQTPSEFGELLLFWFEECQKWTELNRPAKLPPNRHNPNKSPEKTKNKTKSNPIPKKIKGNGIDPNAKITLLVAENPKRNGTKSRQRFNLYRDGMTVQEYLDCGGNKDDLKWDSAREFIKIT